MWGYAGEQSHTMYPVHQSYPQLVEKSLKIAKLAKINRKQRKSRQCSCLRIVAGKKKGF
jgi:exoribonuclease R